MIQLFDPPYDSPAAYVAALNSPAAVAKFDADYAALCDCDALVLALPSGHDAHLEAAFAVGKGKPVFVLLPAPPLPPPELMYRLPGITVVAEIPDLIARLRMHPAIPEKLYVASSWTKTTSHSAVITATRRAGFQTFDYREFPPHHAGEGRRSATADKPERVVR